MSIQPALLDLSQTSEFLQTSERSIRRRTAEGSLPGSRKIGSQVRWDFPLWQLADDVEPVLKAEKSKGDSRQESKDRQALGELAQIIREAKGEPKTAYDLRKKVGCGQDKINRLIRVGLNEGTFVVTGTKIGRKGDDAELITLPVYADQYFTDSRTSETNV